MLALIEQRLVFTQTAIEAFLLIPSQDDVDMKFARSGGSGGQNVNKVNTKVDMRLKLQSARFLSEELKQGLRTRVSLVREITCTARVIRHCNQTRLVCPCKLE